MVRSPPSKEHSRRFLAPPEPALNSILPNGFLEIKNLGEAEGSGGEDMGTAGGGSES